MMRTMSLAGVTAAASVIIGLAILGCGEKSGAPGEREIELIRVVSTGIHKKLVPIRIVGMQGHELRVDDLTLVTLQATDARGQAISHLLTRHPGQSSKYGSYVLIELDAKHAQQRITVCATLRYGGVLYDLRVTYVRRESAGEAYWHEVRRDLNVRTNHEKVGAAVRTIQICPCDKIGPHSSPTV